MSQDGRADVVANDAGDRVTPAVVAYRETEQVHSIIIIIIIKLNIPLLLSQVKMSNRIRGSNRLDWVLLLQIQPTSKCIF